MVDVGDSIPDFKLPDADNNLKTLPVGQKLVLVFYPAAFTGVCQAELCNFRDNLSKFSDRNAKVIAISVDYPFSVKEFQEKNNIDFLLLCDYNKTVIKKFGIEFPNFLDLDGYTVATRSVFIIDEQGIIRYKWLADNPGQEPNYEEIDSQLTSMN